MYPPMDDEYDMVTHHGDNYSNLNDFSEHRNRK